MALCDFSGTCFIDGGQEQRKGTPEMQLVAGSNEDWGTGSASHTKRNRTKTTNLCFSFPFPFCAQGGLPTQRTKRSDTVHDERSTGYVFFACFGNSVASSYTMTFPVSSNMISFGRFQTVVVFRLPDVRCRLFCFSPTSRNPVLLQEGQPVKSASKQTVKTMGRTCGP